MKHTHEFDYGMPIDTKTKNLPKGWDYSRLLSKVKNEYTDSLNYSTTKREKKREQLKLYNNQEKTSERISDNTLYTLMQSWMAVTVSDQKSTTWLGREWMDEDIASNLNHMARFDWDEMCMPEHEIKRRWYEGMFGVSILIKTGWKNNCPQFQTRDPLTWMPDKKGWLCSKNFRFMSFDGNAPVWTLKEKDGYFNLDILKECAGNKSTVTVQNEVAYATPRLMQTGGNNELYDGNEDVGLVDHYTRIEGVPYLVTLANNLSIICRCEQIKPVTKAEKEDPTIVAFPVILRYFSPIPNDPFGVSLSDLSEDQQTSMTILKNLKLLREKDLSLGDTVLVSNRIKNRTDLLKAPSLTQRRFVAVDSDNVANMTAAIPKGTGSSDYYNFEQQLRSDVQMATGISNVQSGVTEDTKRTASEIQAAQRNANARFLLGFQIALVADKEFWKLWLRSYREFMSDTDEKFVRLTGGLIPKVTTLNRKDIVTSEDPDVVLDSEENAKRMNNEVQEAWMATYNFYMEDPALPIIAKALFKRRFYRIVLKLTKEEAYAQIPPSADELQAWGDVQLLNRGQLTLPQDMNEDHYTYLLIYQSAEDSKQKWAAIESRKLAIILSGQTEQAQQNLALQGDSSKMVQGQMTNNLIQKNNSAQNQGQSVNNMQLS